jgi:phytoene dehydrogenase-like protein
MGVTKVLPDWLPESARDRIYRTIGGPWVKYLQRKTTDVLRNELGFSHKLASVFSYIYGYHGATPARSPFAFHAATLFHYRWGAYYPVGGPAHIVECIVPIIERAGGQVAVSSPVERILVDRDTAVGVELASGETIMAPLVISDVGAYGTFMELLPRDVSQRHGYVERFDQIGPSVAHLYLFLGYDEAIDLPQQIFWELPSYDIEDFDAGFKQRMDFERCFGGYLLSPSARDPVFDQRYPNKSTVIALNEAPFEWVERSRSDPAFREQMERDITEYLMRAVHAHMPQLRDKTPAFVRAGMPFGCNPRAWKSCSLGVEPSAERFLKHTHWLRPQTKIRNLYLTGHDTFAMGFASAMLGARLCYATITNNWLFALKKNIGRFP